MLFDLLQSSRANLHFIVFEQHIFFFFNITLRPFVSSTGFILSILEINLQVFHFSSVSVKYCSTNDILYVLMIYRFFDLQINPWKEPPRYKTNGLFSIIEINSMQNSPTTFIRKWCPILFYTKWKKLSLLQWKLNCNMQKTCYHFRCWVNIARYIIQVAC